MHWVPNRSAQRSSRDGSRTAALLTRDLVGAGAQEGVHVVLGSDAAADGEWDEHLVGGAADHVQGCLATLDRRGDVEEHEFVGALGVVAGRELDGVARVAEVHEAGALHHAPGVDVQARDDTFRERHPRTTSSIRIVPE